MRVTRVLSVFVLVCGLTSTGRAQVAPRRPVVQNNPRLMVANPYVYISSDSAQAVAVGEGMRTRMEKVAGGDYTVIERKQMNEALTQYAYPPDAILTPQVARTLANALNAKLVVTSTMVKGEGGRYTVTARLVGMNDDAGNVVTAQQDPGQNLVATGARVADLLAPAIKTYKSGKACIDQLRSKPDKAAEAAREALQKLPTHGLANYCLAMLAQERKQADSALYYLTQAAKGDPLSLEVLTGLAVQYQQRGDSAKTVETFQQMLLVAPTNQKLREEAFKLFLNYGRADAAEKVADEGLALDPTNADLWDLKSNACLYAGKYDCAVQALEMVFSNDSTKADSLYYTKITVAAAQKPDTAKLLKWARAGVNKYPTNGPLLEQLAKAYALSGQLDSTVAVTNRVLAMDSTNTLAALQAANMLAAAGRAKEALPFIQVAAAKGDEQAKQNAAGILINAALPILQKSGATATDYAAAAELLRPAVKIAQPGSQAATSGNYLLGLSTFFQVPAIDPEAEKQKSCELARQEQALLDEAHAAFEIGKTFRAEDSNKYLGYIAQYKPRAESMVKLYCK
ncbi:MAG: hypothetical protein ACOY71_05710 [Gemmatimonadota bacterium]